MIAVDQAEVIRNFCVYKDVIDYAWGKSNIDKWFRCSTSDDYTRYILGPVDSYDQDEEVPIKYVDPHHIVSSTMEIFGGDYNFPRDNLVKLNKIADKICQEVESGNAYVHYTSVRDWEKRHLFYIAGEGKNRVRLFRHLGRQLPISVTGYQNYPDPSTMRIIHSRNFAAALLVHDNKKHILPIPSLALPFWSSYGVPLDSSLGWLDELLHRFRSRKALRDAMYSIQN